MTIELRGCNQDDIDKLIPKNTILLGYRGSIAHGMYLNPDDPNSVDDKDIMGVCFAPMSVYFGLDNFEQRECKLREWDSVVYELKKFVRLLAGSNPNVLSLLWLEKQHYIYMDEYGGELIDQRGLFVSKKIYHSFTGYAYAQLKKMEHATTEGYMGEKRKALVEKYGYDTKNAAHCIRLLRMGIEFLNEGHLYVHRADASQLMEIKTGKWTLEQVKVEATRLFHRAEEVYDRSTLPREPDKNKVNAMLMKLFDHFIHYGDPERS
jgi:predicted nucleotidyltransferase